VKYVARVLSIIAIGGWAVSLFLPALSFRFDSHHDRVLLGYQVLAAGYWHLLALEFSWLANFGFWVVTWLLWFRPERTRALLISAIATALLTLQSVEIFIFNRFFESPQPFAGYYVWFASNLLLSSAALILVSSTKDRFARVAISR
jgi:hypothetical protein